MSKSIDDIMEQPYCCLTCNARFAWGALRTKPPEGEPIAPPFAEGVPALYCPECSSTNVHPADGATHEIGEYHGKIGTVQ